MWGGGDWGPPPPWWIQQQERKKKKKREQWRQGQGLSPGLQRKEPAHPFCGDRMGDPLAKKPKPATAAERLAVAAWEAKPSSSKGSSSKGTQQDPVSVVDGSGAECFKCDRVGHFQA